MVYPRLIGLVFWAFLLACAPVGWAATPAVTGGAVITGKPVIDEPALLDWPADSGKMTPNLSDPTANTLNDFHASIDTCDLVLSTEGNFNAALHDIWPTFLAKFKDQPLQNWFYTTSPPVAPEQMRNHVVQFGNLYAKCAPSLAAGSEALIKKLEAAGDTQGLAQPLLTNYGAVILVKKGNPKHIRTIWDLGRADVRYVTPNPELEPGAFKNYVNTIWAMAANDPRPPKGMTPQKLIDKIFNGASHKPDKWLAGPRIHHRDVPWSIAFGKADAGLILYHLALFTRLTFPDKFDIVPLAGTVAQPQVPNGVKVNTVFLVALKGEWNLRQIAARDKLIETLMSDDFTKILEKRGLKRPADYVSSGNH